MIKVNYIVTKGAVSGRSVHEEEIQKRLRGVELNRIEYIPSNANFLAKMVKRFFSLPRQIRKGINKDDLTHLASEDFAYLLNFIKFKKVVITCHDLIPLVYRRYSPFLWLNMRGLKRADRIITVSNFSKNDIIKRLKYPADKIDVINNAVDHSRYYQQRNKEILKRFGIKADEKVVLYVGSERKRQNLPFLIKSFYQLKKRLPKVKLIKVGSSQSKENLIKLVKDLGLAKEVIFTGFVDKKELPKIYNAVDLFVYPCLYAGFGIPPLEAMACGTPVITSNLTSLPEVVGNAGIMINPYNKEQMVEAMFKVLTNEELKKDLIVKGLQRAKMFSWEKAAEQTLDIYRRIVL